MKAVMAYRLFLFIERTSCPRFVHLLLIGFLQIHLGLRFCQDFRQDCRKGCRKKYRQAYR